MKFEESQTYKNLQTALKEESLAYLKYTIYGNIAKEQGFGYIAKIFEESYFELFNNKIQNQGIYLKGLGYNFNTIKNQIDLNKPVILSLWSSPKYKNHTITVIGYKDNNTLIINDNWSIKQTEIIYKDISLISSINIIV